MAFELTFLNGRRGAHCCYEVAEEIVLIYDHAGKPYRHPKSDRYEVVGVGSKDTLIELVALLMEQGLWPDD